MDTQTKKMFLNINLNYNLFYSSSINLSKHLNILKERGVNLESIDNVSPDMFSKKSLSLFLIDADFINDKGGIDVLNSYSNTECVIFLINNPEEVNLIPEDLILNYITEMELDHTQIFLKVIKSSLKALVRHKKIFELEKSLFLAEDEIDELHAIATALSTVKDLDKLLSLILKRCIDATASDAGSLYLIKEDENKNNFLQFMLSDNFSLDIKSVSFTLPLDKTSIAGYVALTKKILNIEDSYNLDNNAEYKHSKKFDEQYNYKTKSILTFPMINHKDDVIGVIQLVNKRINRGVILDSNESFEKYVIPFTSHDERYVFSLGSQAAVVLENAILYENIQTLFEGFIKASVQAIDDRDPTTSGHSLRVAAYTVNLAKAINHTKDGKYAGTNFSDQQIKEIRYASLLHDFGKVGVREHVLVKAEKLYPHQKDIIKARIELIKKDIIAKYQAKKLNYIINNSGQDFDKVFTQIDTEMNNEIQRISKYLDDILQLNLPKVLSDEDTGNLDEITKFIYTDFDGNNNTLLTEDEIFKLKIPRGSLDSNERKEIEDHVVHTFKFLSKIPWTNELKNVPEIAFAHHEKLNKTGYPRGLNEKQIPIQSKIMTIADIYDALTASDRPYKKAVPVDKALKILGFEVEDNHLDNDLVEIFIRDKIFQKDKII